MKIIPTMTSLLITLIVSMTPVVASDWNTPGKHRIVLIDDTGTKIPIGTVSFEQVGNSTAYQVEMDPALLQDYFLSMREFKCVTGDDVQCHVKYPYKHAQVVTESDLAWLEHDLIFLTKTPSEFGAKFENGVYYKLEITAAGLSGTPQDIDLNAIASPPDDLSTPPYDESLRLPAIRQRWIVSLLVESEIKH